MASCGQLGGVAVQVPDISLHVLRPTQPLILWVPGVLPSGWGKAAHSLVTRADVDNTWIYTSTPPYVLMAQL
jgi:hypothetical protein